MEKSERVHRIFLTQKDVEVLSMMMGFAIGSWERAARATSPDDTKRVVDLIMVQTKGHPYSAPISVVRARAERLRDAWEKTHG